MDEGLKARLDSMDAELEHWRVTAGHNESAYKQAATDARFWFEKWRAAFADTQNALDYAVHFGNCEWHQEGDTCTCGLFELLARYGR